ncbi:hypothetical protein [Ralstonia solanacearum]|uniref:hypothetical protein n=1 Tax=Ralstonia solanacearum TaxID=305 RepID=UPI003CC8587E
MDARKNDWHTLGRPRELGVISGWIQPLTRFITVEPDGGDAEDFVKNFEPDAIAGPIALPNSRDYVGHQATDWRAWQPSVTTLICITRSSTGARRRKASERNAGNTRTCRYSSQQSGALHRQRHRVRDHRLRGIRVSRHRTENGAQWHRIFSNDAGDIAG